jgi:hypothetical protein
VSDWATAPRVLIAAVMGGVIAGMVLRAVLGDSLPLLAAITAAAFLDAVYACGTREEPRERRIALFFAFVFMLATWALVLLSGLGVTL